MLFISPLLAHVALCGLASAEPETNGLLKNERSKITFVPYTPEQRQSVARYAKTVLSVWTSVT